MQLSITKKLVLAFLGLTFVVLIATLGLARWSFERGFLDYVNTLEQNRLQWLQEVLVREYGLSGGNWESMSPARFDALLGIVIAAPVGQVAAGRRADPQGGGPPPGHSPGPPRADGPPRGQPPPQSRRRHLGPPTALYAADGRQIAGATLDGAAAEYVHVPIIVGDETVGELRSKPRRELISPQDTAFSGQQFRMSLVIGIAALAFAAAMSFALAHGLLAPVRRMITNVARLSSGDYTARLQERRTDELGQLMADLDHLGKTLEEERSTRRRWFADISHELRTPLTILVGEIQALRDGIRNFDAKQLESLDQEVQRLRLLIDDLYDLSVSDVGGLRYSMSVFDLSETLVSAATAARSRAKDSGLDIDTDIAPGIRISGDRKRIDQLFQNLFENSIAYTDAPGRIEVTLAGSDGSVVVEFHDTEPGASPEECEKLFEPLYRREASRNRRTGGAGLGLAICRNIVEAHRGTITASPSPSGGLCIRIEIPSASETRT